MRAITHWSKLKAITQGKSAKDGSTDDTGLENELLLCKVARVIITRNLRTSAGLSQWHYGDDL